MPTVRSSLIARRPLNCRAFDVILVINCGSSSLKYSLFDEDERTCARGAVESIDQTESKLVLELDGERAEHATDVGNYADALGAVVDLLSERIRPEDWTVEAVGHRVVHGGERSVGSAQITPDVEREIAACAALAPLHNPAALEGIRAARRYFAGAAQVAVFDTAFHQTMPPRAFLYAVPRALYAEQGIRRYGFHGTSHRYVAQRASQLLDAPLVSLNLITCHLGNGCSLAAIAGGRSVDTTMGLTPLEGVAMGTRSGDVDPALIFHLARGGMALDEIEHMLLHQSGLLGLSARSQDMRALEAAASGGDDAAAEAIEVFCYRVRKAIGSYCAVLGRVDALVFTGGIGEHSASMRQHVLDGLHHMGLQLDAARNRQDASCEGEISLVDSPVKILVVPTNEELVIAREVRDALAN